MGCVIKINEYSKTPKYKQIINSIISGVEKEVLKVGDQLPSVNNLLIKFDISRDTIVKAYEHLKQIGIIDSIPGKGYYIKSNNFRQKAKVFLLFNKLSVHKKIIYDAFSQTLGDQAAIDFLFIIMTFGFSRTLSWITRMTTILTSSSSHTFSKAEKMPRNLSIIYPSIN